MNITKKKDDKYCEKIVDEKLRYKKEKKAVPATETMNKIVQFLIHKCHSERFQKNTIFERTYGVMSGDGIQSRLAVDRHFDASMVVIFQMDESESWKVGHETVEKMKSWIRDTITKELKSWLGSAFTTEWPNKEKQRDSRMSLTQKEEEKKMTPTPLRGSSTNDESRTYDNIMTVMQIKFDEGTIEIKIAFSYDRHIYFGFHYKGLQQHVYEYSSEELGALAKDLLEVMASYREAIEKADSIQEEAFLRQNMMTMFSIVRAHRLNPSQVHQNVRRAIILLKSWKYKLLAAKQIKQFIHNYTIDTLCIAAYYFLIRKKKYTSVEVLDIVHFVFDIIIWTSEKVIRNDLACVLYCSFDDGAHLLVNSTDIEKYLTHCKEPPRVLVIDFIVPGWSFFSILFFSPSKHFFFFWSHYTNKLESLEKDQSCWEEMRSRVREAQEIMRSEGPTAWIDTLIPLSHQQPS
ncbi:hypothetical protein RFI_24132 [Reticulomyxa filosa]|uniref:Uncharacterized protein n=1 Tax=Reticulomyxa filosa TaxID=46433 RepID=X6MGU9_RETFI|nr:hypothetical protein RFI_24132 [Reticulomyxa filosa]|eukprot:ETO13243.1 hypothetical protein RFI_24132 [Reticulomyxa filosa]